MAETVDVAYNLLSLVLMLRVVVVVVVKILVVGGMAIKFEGNEEGEDW